MLQSFEQLHNTWHCVTLRRSVHCCREHCLPLVSKAWEKFLVAAVSHGLTWSWSVLDLTLQSLVWPQCNKIRGLWLQQHPTTGYLMITPVEKNIFFSGVNMSNIYNNSPPSPVVLPRYPSYCPFSDNLKCQTNVAVLSSPSPEEPSSASCTCNHILLVTRQNWIHWIQSSISWPLLCLWTNTNIKAQG